ncbi:8-oxo-dGTP pyrophosphatase MutT (NUDIX family) [Altererythrobacter atlanticus]|uniref:NUDIX hydrolase n=1 Tax=Croceibacterium atlanticum TaxID=1267766 RepID=A0A0F7KR25_9SPHN|nr:CoA pyrophosphatase [Croceibacterium atlanticum]AKH42029.1 putative NUDIX hydrolase [Croceibacterium atlanticum]MBB5733403.1 8-oxo-dGTP pyrophosphatase MutT (NUDIX family) [Croceibacterium atlanticum]
MSVLFDRLQKLFDEGHGVELPDLRSDAIFAPPEIRPAAVLIAVTDRPEPGVLLTHRPEDMRAHPGQVAFPGGKLDPGEDAVEAALREAHEELAVEPSSVRIIGASDRYITGSGYDVTPVLGLVPPDLPIRPNPMEVSAWFEPPLRYLFDPANHVQKQREWQGRTRHYIEIEWQGHRIWGITAAIISNLSRRLAWQELING